MSLHKVRLFSSTISALTKQSVLPTVTFVCFSGLLVQEYYYMLHTNSSSIVGAVHVIDVITVGQYVHVIDVIASIMMLLRDV